MLPKVDCIPMPFLWKAIYAEKFCSFFVFLKGVLLPFMGIETDFRIIWQQMVLFCLGMEPVPFSIY
jgi:hypothetical protein